MRFSGFRREAEAPIMMVAPSLMSATALCRIPAGPLFIGITGDCAVGALAKKPSKLLGVPSFRASRTTAYGYMNERSSSGKQPEVRRMSFQTPEMDWRLTVSLISSQAPQGFRETVLIGRSVDRI
jgi:hypothetical protein